MTDRPQYARVAAGKTKLQFVLPVELYARLRKRADQEQTTMTAIVIAAVDDYLDRARSR